MPYLFWLWLSAILLTDPKTLNYPKLIALVLARFWPANSDNCKPSTSKWSVWIIPMSALLCSCQMAEIRTRESETHSRLPVLDWLLTNGGNRESRGHRMASYSSQVLMTGELSLDVIRGTCWSMDHAENRMFSTLHKYKCASLLKRSERKTCF